MATSMRRQGFPFTFVLAVLSVLFSAVAAHAAVVVPTQWIAKQYSEALGRAPDASGWQSLVDFFTVNDCNQANLKQQGRNFYLSTEFNNAYGANDVDYKELVAYRGILNREPDQAGYDSFNQQLHSGAPTWKQFVDQLFANTEFGD